MRGYSSLGAFSPEMTHAQDIGSPPHALRGRSSVRDPARVLESLKRDATAELTGILAGFWGTIEEQVRLTALAGHNYNASQDDRAALLGVSQRAQVLATRYREAIEEEFEHWLHPKSARASTAKSFPRVAIPCQCREFTCSRSSPAIVRRVPPGSRRTS